MSDRKFQEKSPTTLGAVLGVSKEIILTPVISGSAYAANDVFFETVELPKAIMSEGGRAVLHSVTIIDKSANANEIQFIIFEDEQELGTINGAVDFDDTEANSVTCKFKIETTDYDTFGSKEVAQVLVNRYVQAAAGSQSVFIAAKLAASGTWAVGAVRLKFYFMED